MVFPTQDVFANRTPELNGDDVHDSSSGSRVPHDPFITKSAKFSGGGHLHRTANVLSEVRLSQSQALQACSHAAPDLIDTRMPFFDFSSCPTWSNPRPDLALACLAALYDPAACLG